MVGGLLREELLDRNKVTVTDVHKRRLQELHDSFGVRITADNQEAVSHADIVVLAVKPQSMPAVMRSMGRAFKDDAVLLSIVAGFVLYIYFTLFLHSARVLRRARCRIG